ncbi:MAG: hypothetical protein ABWZ02_06975 [Nakamurella sp.]
MSIHSTRAAHPIAGPSNGADPAHQRARRHRAAAAIGVTGSILGVVAGIAQATIGSQIPDWSGAKASPVPLGLLTIGLSALAGWAAIRQRNPRLSVWQRAACALALIGPGLLCLSTVGRLWYPSAVLLLIAGTVSIDSWSDTARAAGRDWFRVLLTVIGGFEILMAAGSAPLLMMVGVAGGIALMVVAWLRASSRTVLVALVVAGTIPFAALAWTAIVPVLLAVVALAVAVPVIRDRQGLAGAHGQAS